MSPTLRLPLLCGLAFLAVHWLSQALGTYGLMFDEAQYWFWAKHAAWGYYSKPPVIAWVIALGTAIAGDNDFGVKMLSPVLLLATAFVLHAIARRLNYTPRIATWVVLTYLTLPYVSGNATFITTDVPLQLCWAVALYAAITAIRRPSGESYWLLVGLAAGLGLLSKYTMIAFAASTLLALCTQPGAMRQLRSPWLWMGALLALLLFAPNLVWNSHHHFVTFNHTNDNVFSKHVALYPGDMLEFAAAQLVIFGPVLLVALITSLRSLRRGSDAALLHCYVWPLAFAGILVSLAAGAQAHWISPCYLAGTLIAVPWLAEHAPRWLKLSLGLHLLILLLFLAAPHVTPHFSRDPLARLFVWNALAQRVAPLAREHPHALLLTNERKIAAALTYQLRADRGAEIPVYKWSPDGAVRDHYDLLTQQADLHSHDLLLITRGADCPPDLPVDASLLASYKLEGFAFRAYWVPRFAGFATNSSNPAPAPAARTTPPSCSANPASAGNSQRTAKAAIPPPIPDFS